MGKVSLIERARNIWFLSSISKEEMIENPHSFIQRAINAEESPKGYIAGLSEEEENFNNSLNADGKDTLIS